MDRASSGELDMLGKRKAPPTASPSLPGGATGAGAAAAPLPATVAPARTHQRAPSGPACSSPALWRSSAAGDDACQATGDSARGKCVRVCTAAAADAAASGAAAAAAPPGGETQPLVCHGSTGGMHALCSLPSGSLCHSFHAGCCSRLSSSNSLAELEAAASAAVDSLASAEDTWAAVAVAAQQQPADASSAAAQQAQQQRQPQQQHDQWLEEDEQAAVSYWADVPDDILKRVRA